MRMLPYFAGAALLAALAAAQMPEQMPGVGDSGAPVPEQATPGAAPTDIPDIPSGEDPMNLRPDPAAGSEAAQAPAEARDEQDQRAAGETSCQVKRAATDTGFIVVCE